MTTGNTGVESIFERQVSLFARLESGHVITALVRRRYC